MPYMYRTLNQFGELFERTPNIHQLSARLKSDDNDQQFETSVQSITILKLFVVGSSSGIFNILQKMPNLYRLMIKAFNIMIDGYQWQKVIVNYLPKLKVFEFYMNYQLHDCDDMEKAIDDLLKSYHTSYWLVDRQCLPDFSRAFHISPSTCTTRTKPTCPSEADC
ncbi:unnamed protein product [Rotaria sp. Silwood1]|nr:unnamed protein product [Rotaria sp. Silwood1]